MSNNINTFHFAPNWGAELTKKPKTHQLSFGDGYEQRAAKGLNANLRRYALRFTGTREKINAINAFLDEHAGYKAFHWQPPHENQLAKFKCEEWKIINNDSFSELSCEFQEVVA